MMKGQCKVLVDQRDVDRLAKQMYSVLFQIHGEVFVGTYIVGHN